MSDEDALLRAIVEAPDDLALRMVYADWCEEHGRAARAALIRGQCFLDPVLVPPSTELVGYSSRSDGRYLAPFHLSQDLRESVLAPFRQMVEEEGIDWRADSFTSPRRSWYQVRRGFVERLQLYGLVHLRQIVRHAPHILRHAPILEIRVDSHLPPVYDEGRTAETHHLPHALVGQLVSVEGIERLRALDLSRYTLGQAAARVLLLDGGRLRLTRLELAHRSLTRTIIRDLESRFGPALQLSEDDDIPF
jgi:uncharacterized protein (TIGR02996 family)